MAFDQFNAHLGEVTKVLMSPDGRYVFSSGADGTVFVFSVTEYANDSTILKQEINVTSVKDEQARMEIVDSKTPSAYSQLQTVVDE